ncbi:hypothetical protein [Roseateles oligotrophus]|uniref:Uncharacterized protein n=1 Tax=Roseateles oligotrophus TaxID=1769250 RepID=A0ABT2YM65_9BURK|nr:hypothetical protein [Roseateles oligotrophus]MCV2371162.1 hypothetical protein [Roseateles oligotrophus]
MGLIQTSSSAATEKACTKTRKERAGDGWCSDYIGLRKMNENGDAAAKRPINEQPLIDGYRLDLQRQIASLQSRLIKADLDLLMAVGKEREACAALVEASTESARTDASRRAGIPQPMACPIAKAIRERADQSCRKRLDDAV